MAKISANKKTFTQPLLQNTLLKWKATKYHKHTHSTFAALKRSSPPPPQTHALYSSPTQQLIHHPQILHKVHKHPLPVYHFAAKQTCTHKLTQHNTSSTAQTYTQCCHLWICVQILWQWRSCWHNRVTIWSQNKPQPQEHQKVL